MSIQIDAHQHYWQPSRADYHWMTPDEPVLFRPYGPDDLWPHLSRHRIAGTVLVQAAQTVAETEYILDIADATESVLAVVGWIDFENPGDLRHLERWARHPKFVGVRPMIQDIPDVDWMLRDDVQWAYRAIIDLDLTFDALGFPQHLDNFHTLFTRYPDMRTVIDHCMKPQIRDHAQGPRVFGEWAEGMSKLAEQTPACCKLSGIVTEADENWTVDDLRPYTNHVLTAFGADRVMWGSDWPVCRLRADYDDWRAAAEDLTQHLADNRRARIFGGTAIEFYRLEI